MILFLPIVFVLPFILEAKTASGFGGRKHRRHPLFYLLVPLTSLWVFISLAALLGHPIIACIAWVFSYVGLTVVSNVKNKVLGEPLDSPDLETARHLFIYPEFYIDYVGAWRVFSVFGSLGLLIIVSIIFETPILAGATPLPGFLNWILGAAAYVALMIVIAKLIATIFTDARARRLGLSYDVATDTARFGLFPQMLLYALLLLDKSSLKGLETRKPVLSHTGTRPDLLAFQAESFFDIDRLYQKLEGHGNHNWPALVTIRNAGADVGTLDVPAWGASTMQSEFAFQSGIANERLGVDRINPYQRVAYKDVHTIAKRLREVGYRTVCIHPAKKEFFRRATVIPKLGFDSFIGLEAFEDAARYGPYVSDQALGDKIEEVISDHKATSDAPLFLFAITIESHGPWDEGRLAEWNDEAALEAADPTKHRGFALFRQHMDNAMALFSRLGPNASLTDRPRAMALYGDHQPAFQPLFEQVGFDGTGTDYILWHSDGGLKSHEHLKVEELGDALLKAAGFETKP